MSAPANTIAIEGELTVFAVHALKERLLTALDQAPRLLVDVSGVSEVDGAGIQLLLAARREALQRSGTLTLIGAPPQLIEALTLTDLARVFDTSPAPELEPTA